MATGTIGVTPSTVGPQGPAGAQGPAGTTDHTLLTNVGTNTHAAIDTHVASTANPHAVTKAQVGLAAVPNTDATARANHTGTQSADTLADGTTNKAFLATERTKLTGVATGATANDTDANLKARANHTGTQAAATISDFAEALDDRVAALLVAGANVGLTYNDVAGTITIVATDTNTTDPEVVRDTIAAALVAGANVTITPNDAGDTITIAATAGGGGAPTDATYIVQTANAGLSAEQALAALATGLLKVTTATGVLSTATAADLPAHSSAHDDRFYTEAEADGLLTAKAPLASPTFTGTVAGITKAMVGLGSADNTSDANKPVSTAQQTALDAKQPLDTDLTAIAALADPNADRILFWDDSAGAFAYLAPGTGLAITATTIDATGGGSGGTGGDASYVFATSDASAAEKAQADATLAASGAQTAINAVIDSFAYATNGPAGGTIRIVGPNVSLSGSILLRRGVSIVGAGQVTTQITATTNAPIFAAKDSAVKTDHVEVANLSLYSSVATTLIDFRWIGRSRIRSLALYGTDAAGSVGIRFGGDLTAAQTTAGVACWTNRVESCRIAGVERCFWFKGLNAATPTVETPNAIRIASCELIPTNTALSTVVDIEDGDGNWVGDNDIGYAALAGGIRLGNNAGKAIGNSILPNRFEAIATSGTRRPIEVFGTSYSGNIVHEQFYTDGILYPRVQVQNQTNSLTKVETTGATELLDRSYGGPVFQAPDQYWPAAFKIALDQNYTIPNPAATYPHQSMLVRFAQDATGGRTVTWGTAYDVGGWAPNAAPSSVSVIGFLYDPAAAIWRVVRADPPSVLRAAAGTDTNPPILLSGGALLTTPQAGAEEYDGELFYETPDPTTGRRYRVAPALLRLAAAGAAIGPTITNFFGTTPALNLVAGGVYEVEALLFYTKTTAGTVTWTLATGGTFANIAGTVLTSATGGIGASASPTLVGLDNNTTGVFPASTSLTTATEHSSLIKMTVEMNAAGTIRLRATMGAGTITPRRGSWMKVTRLPAAVLIGAWS